MATHSSILAWRITWTEEPGFYSPWGRKELDTTETFFLSFLLAWAGFTKPFSGLTLSHPKAHRHLQTLFLCPARLPQSRRPLPISTQWSSVSLKLCHRQWAFQSRASPDPWALLVTPQRVCLSVSRRRRKGLLRGARMSLESKQSSRRKLRPQRRTPLRPHPLRLRGLQPLKEKRLQRKTAGTSPRPRWALGRVKPAWTLRLTGQAPAPRAIPTCGGQQGWSCFSWYPRLFPTEAKREGGGGVWGCPSSPGGRKEAETSPEAEDGGGDRSGAGHPGPAWLARGPAGPLGPEVSKGCKRAEGGRRVWSSTPHACCPSATDSRTWHSGTCRSRNGRKQPTAWKPSSLRPRLVGWDTGLPQDKGRGGGGVSCPKSLAPRACCTLALWCTSPGQAVPARVPGSVDRGAAWGHLWEAQCHVHLAGGWGLWGHHSGERAPRTWWAGWGKGRELGCEVIKKDARLSSPNPFCPLPPPRPSDVEGEIGWTTEAVPRAVFSGGGAQEVARTAVCPG